MPEELTPLFHVPSYTTLTAAQRLRYNQLNALYFNEQTMFFEVSLARNVLGWFLSQPALPSGLKESLAQFLIEEERHSDMFRQLNRRSARAIYSSRDFHFIRVPPLAAYLLDVISKRPHYFPFLLWLMHLHEERAIHMGKAFVKSQEPLEPHFAETQRRHLADEIGHVRWDESLIDWLWPRAGAFTRHWNIRLFSWMMEEFFTTPKRAGMRVVSALADEFPGLRPRLPEFHRELLALGTNPAYRRSLYNSENVPATFRRFDAHPEFRALTRSLPGYIPGGSSP